MDPTTIAQGISSGGLAYLLAAVSLICSGVILHLYRELGRLRDRIEQLQEGNRDALLAAKEVLIAAERAHQDVVVGLLKGQLSITDETRDLLIKIHAAMERMQQRP